VITIPIGMAVFRTFSQGLQHHLPKAGSLGRLYTDICGSAAHTTTKTCGKAISQHTPATMKFLGMSLNLSAREAHGFPTVLPYYMLVGLVVLTGWYQVRQTQARQLQSGNAAPNAQMQAMTKVFPIIFGLITLGINAGATLYFVVSNAWRIGQQHLVIGKMYDQAIAAGDLKPSKDPTPAPADDDAGGNGARARGKPNSPKTPPNKKPPATRQPNAKGSSGGSNNGAGAQGMTPGARRKKKRKR
jgi:hypothetical protein